MTGRSLILFALAGLMAFGTAFIIRNKVLGGSGDAAAHHGTRVLVATTDITPGSFIRADQHLTWMEWPEHSLNDAFLIEGKVDPQTFNGAVARRHMLKGEPINEQVLVQSNEGGFMSAVLKAGMRAVSIAVDSTTGNAGFIFPGDRVDLIITHSVEMEATDDSSPEPVLASETFIEDVRVLAVDQQLDNPTNTAILAKTVTLEVSKRQAEKINVAKDLGKISLSLRSLATDEDDAALASAESHFNFTRDSDVSNILSPRHSSASKVVVIRGEDREQLEFNHYAP